MPLFVINDNASLALMVEGIRLHGRPLGGARDKTRLIDAADTLRLILESIYAPQVSLEMEWDEAIFNGFRLVCIRHSSKGTPSVSAVTILKIGDAQILKEELARFQQYAASTLNIVVRPTIALHEHPIKDTEEFLGVLHIQIPVDKVDAWGIKNYAAVNNGLTLTKALENYFFATTSVWYMERQFSFEAVPLSEMYIRRLRIDQNRLGKSLEIVKPDWLGAQQVKVQTHNKVYVYPNMAYKYKDLYISLSCFQSISHGLPVGKSLLFNDITPYPINFDSTEYGHILHDIALLEAELKAICMSERTPLAERIAFESALLNAFGFFSPDNPYATDTELFACFQHVVTLRQIGANLTYPRETNKDYLLALSFAHLWSFMQPHYSIGNRQHALVAAGMFAESLF